jgi:hypothetical protein
VAMSQGVQATSRIEKSKGWLVPESLQNECSPADT